MARNVAPAWPRAAEPRRRDGTALTRDRLFATIFLAALLHGILILGLTFGTASRPGGEAPGLEVLKVSDQVPEANRNDSAAYLAARTQLGSGTAAAARSPRSPASSPGAAGDAARSDPGHGAGSDEPVVTTRAEPLRVRLVTDRVADPASADPASADPRSAEDVELASRTEGRDDVDDLELRGPQRAELLITPDTRESLVAPYLDAWRGKVERIGTLNYPTAARREALTRNPTLEVTLAADGRLAAATVRTSSGLPELDQAAVDILKLASPFDPFPSELAARYATLRFAYEWQFVDGRAARGRLSTPADSP
jgi:protein TonB